MPWESRGRNCSTRLSVRTPRRDRGIKKQRRRTPARRLPMARFDGGRRDFAMGMLLAPLLGVAEVGSADAEATEFEPDRGPVRLLVGFTAGGTNDILARAIAPALGRALGASVVVE